MKLEEIKKLTELARIDMSEEEMNGVAKDFDSILAYVGQVQEITKLVSKEEGANNTNLNHINIIREDVATENKEKYAEKIIKEMPDTEDRFLKVKQIL